MRGLLMYGLSSLTLLATIYLDVLSMFVVEAVFAFF